VNLLFLVMEKQCFLREVGMTSYVVLMLGTKQCLIHKSEPVLCSSYFDCRRWFKINASQQRLSAADFLVVLTGMRKTAKETHRVHQTVCGNEASSLRRVSECFKTSVD
jgi:hypothetical protein